MLILNTPQDRRSDIVKAIFATLNYITQRLTVFSQHCRYRGLGVRKKGAICLVGILFHITNEQTITQYLLENAVFH